MVGHQASHPLPGPIPQRVRLVIALTEVNSRHLRAETRMAAADIELERALQDCREGVVDSDSPAMAERCAQLQSQLDNARDALTAIETERTWLEQELTDFDNDTPKASRREWQ